MSNRLSGVYLITDTSRQQRFSHRELAEQAQRAGVPVVQYRNKETGGRRALADIRGIADSLAGTGTSLIVNDRADYVLAGKADGVHLGQDDLPIKTARSLLGEARIIGGSSSTVEEARLVEQQGADYVALGHIFESQTKKKDYPPRGLEMLREVCSALSIPVVAIGGITLDNAPEVIGAGADMIAVSSAICMARDPYQKARAFMGLF
ncbi:thiamine phosphate synthase [Fodinibius sediminis]|nr:thiamine phosphate synthase [Fodinibius sediminis]